MAKHGNLFVVSSPSGAGKHVIIEHILQADPQVVYSVSATTRPPRKNEVDGRHYHFLEREEFCRRSQAGDFLEWAEVHGNLYGTLRSEMAGLLESGKDVILELDVQGMRNLEEQEFEFTSIFIMAPSLDELRRRLELRGANTPEDIELRIENAENEMQDRRHYDYVVLNEKLEDAVADVHAIIRAQRCRTRAN